MHVQVLLVLTSVLATRGPAAPAAPPASDAPAAGAPKTTRVTAPDPPALWVFHFHAAASAEATRGYATRAAMDGKVRADLLGRIDAYLARVDDAVRRDPIGPDTLLATAQQRGDALKEEFEQQLGEWIERHPAAGDAIQRQGSVVEAYATALRSDPAAIVKAARPAGLPAAREAEATRLVTDRRQRLETWQADADRRRAAAPPADAELFETALGYDAQRQLVAAATEVRDAVEAMLPRPADRPWLEGEMLRWLVNAAAE